MMTTTTDDDDDDFMGGAHASVDLIHVVRLGSIGVKMQITNKLLAIERHFPTPIFRNMPIVHVPPYTREPFSPHFNNEKSQLTTVQNGTGEMCVSRYAAEIYRHLRRKRQLSKLQIVKFYGKQSNALSKCVAHIWCERRGVGKLADDECGMHHNVSLTGLLASV
jgi:hypothetical protein